MTGLGKIVKHIADKGDLSSKTILNDANSQAEQIINEAKEKAQLKLEEILNQSKLDVDLALSRAESTAVLQKKKILLDAKQQEISSVIQLANEKLLSLSDNQYFETILKMIKKYANKKKGEILFSQKDKKRLPANFQSKINDILADFGGATLSISDKTRDINGGFVLLYGEIEENCSFDALFFANKDYLQDKVSDLLFS